MSVGGQAFRQHGGGRWEDLRAAKLCGAAAEGRGGGGGRELAARGETRVGMYDKAKCGFQYKIKDFAF